MLQVNEGGCWLVPLHAHCMATGSPDCRPASDSIAADPAWHALPLAWVWHFGWAHNLGVCCLQGTPVVPHDIEPHQRYTQDADW